MPLWLPSADEHPGYIAGRVYSAFGGNASSGSTTAVDTLYVYPFPIKKPVSITALLARVVTGGTGSAMKAGIYANSRSGTSLGLPIGAPLAVNNTGVATTSSSTNVSLAMSVALSPGIYWFAQKHTGTIPTLTTISGAQFGMGALIGRASGGSLASQATALKVADTYSNNLPTLVGSESWSDETSSAVVAVLHFAT